MRYANKVQFERIIFDPKNTDHLKIYHRYTTTGQWPGKFNTCPFLLKWPYFNVLDMIQSEIVEQHLKNLIKVTKK